MFERPDSGDSVVLVSLDFGDADYQDSLEELHRLAESANLTVVGVVEGKRARPDSATFAGSGKVEEIALAVRESQAGLVIFNHPLSPAQERNLERRLECRVIDRTSLILDIFAQRARSHEGKLQVELAQLEHLATRLVRGWTHLERQKGGIGLRGPGETQLETDRRLLGKRVKLLKERLSKLRRQRDVQRRARQRSKVLSVSLVGYTNAGKSTLFNRMTGADVLAKDMLFATLDPTMRGIVLPSGRKIIASDTVGFISDLPTQLVAAFRATLEEVLEADLVLHVRDISHPESAEQAADVADILASLGVRAGVPMFEVWNKLDLVDASQHEALAVQAANRQGVFPVSALTGEGVEVLLEAVSVAFDEAKSERRLELSFAEGKRRAWLHGEGVVLAEVQGEDGWQIDVLWTARQEKRFREL